MFRLLIFSALFTEGRPHSLSRPNYILYWNEEMRNGFAYGHMCLFGLKQLVSPLFTGFRNTPWEEDYPPNYTLAERTRAQGGAVTYAHPAVLPVFSDVSATARELPVDVALGQIDAVDVLSNYDEIASMKLWYHLLNCGFHLAISAGSDSQTNMIDHFLPGGQRVYVHTGGSQLDYAEWIRNYRRGRSFAGNGPIILFTADAKEPGDEIRFPSAGPRKFRIRADVRSRIPIDRVEVVVNGRPVISRTAPGMIDEDVTLDRSAWIAVRAMGPVSRLVANDAQAFAHTSPVYVYFGNQPIASRADARFCLDWVDQLIQSVGQRGHFIVPAHKQEVMTLFDRAREVYRKIEQVAPAD